MLQTWMQLQAPFVCLKLPTEKSSTRRLFCRPNHSGLRDGAPLGYFVGHSLSDTDKEKS
jgi:hypothetical protein